MRGIRATPYFLIRGIRGTMTQLFVFLEQGWSKMAGDLARTGTRLAQTGGGFARKERALISAGWAGE